MADSEHIIAGGQSFVLTRAKSADADAVVAVLEDAARWLVGRDIGQWQPGNFPRAPILARIALGEINLARNRDDPAGTVTLQWKDAPCWTGPCAGPSPPTRLIRASTAAPTIPRSMPTRSAPSSACAPS